MTLQIKSSDSIDNLPILQVRSILKRLGSDLIFCLAYFEDRGITEDDAQKLGKSLLRLGYIDFEKEFDGKRWYKLTEKGRGFLRSSAAPRIKRQTAEKVLADLVERVTQLNASPDYLVSVTGLVVFGSYLSDKPDLGDLDVGWCHVPRMFPGEEMERWHERCIEHFCKSGRQAKTIMDDLTWPEDQARLFLKNRKRSISLHGIDEISRMAAQNPDFQYRIMFGEAATLIQSIGVAPLLT